MRFENPRSGEELQVLAEVMWQAVVDATESEGGLAHGEMLEILVNLTIQLLLTVPPERRMRFTRTFQKSVENAIRESLD